MSSPPEESGGYSPKDAGLILSPFEPARLKINPAPCSEEEWPLIDLTGSPPPPVPPVPMEEAEKEDHGSASAIETFDTLLQSYSGRCGSYLEELQGIEVEVVSGEPEERKISDSVEKKIEHLDLEKSVEAQQQSPSTLTKRIELRRSMKKLKEVLSKYWEFGKKDFVSWNTRPAIGTVSASNTTLHQFQLCNVNGPGSFYVSTRLPTTQYRTFTNPTLTLLYSR